MDMALLTPRENLYHIQEWMQDQLLRRKRLQAIFQSLVAMAIQGQADTVKEEQVPCPLAHHMGTLDLTTRLSQKLDRPSRSLVSRRAAPVEETADRVQI